MRSPSSGTLGAVNRTTKGRLRLGVVDRTVEGRLRRLGAVVRDFERTVEVVFNSGGDRISKNVNPYPFNSVSCQILPALASAQPRPAETTRSNLDARLVQPRLGFGPERATQFAHTYDPTPFRGPASSLIQPSCCPSVAQLLFVAQLSSTAQLQRLAQLARTPSPLPAA
ncbi:hypothetical protein CRG98_014380 [Punica granatum]|uniref:Uncharacterized protein n=1 Tax=Punica granatum TaxID=22663 RepID=A0A2I0K9M2_PUNGR|nr:hypothetical protein CRG98_014380 [Punica granatum]